MKGVVMSIYDRIVQKFQADVQSLAQAGENNNGKIDTVGEKQQLANLLSGAIDEIRGLYLENEKRLNQKQDSNSKKIIGSLWNERNIAEDSVSTYADSFVLEKTAFKIKKDGSYETISKETKDTVCVSVLDKDENEIARKAYTKSKNALYTNKEKVAHSCGLSIKNDAEQPPSQLKRFLCGLIPIVGSRMFDAEDNMRGALNRLADDEAIDFNSGILYKWNSQTYEYEKVGKLEASPDQHTYAATRWGEKSYDIK